MKFVARVFRRGDFLLSAASSPAPEEAGSNILLRFQGMGSKLRAAAFH